MPYFNQTVTKTLNNFHSGSVLCVFFFTDSLFPECESSLHQILTFNYLTRVAITNASQLASSYVAYSQNLSLPTSGSKVRFLGINELGHKKYRF
ncbi:hypothetical protein CDAR_371651 [Caerostris darwini]|uniref:Uncharacterized protein n=1 Tax=Caerostris darwini TaxID=1538125 RepID=A0AAV4X828_9ARAC|nr:hypothetical protein CDAR_371651 [Caerostris darwini]